MADLNNLDKLRERIDEVDDSMMELLEERLKISEEIASYKKENNLSVHDKEREREKLSSVRKSVSEKYRHYSERLYSTLAELSREHQNAFASSHGVGEETGRYGLIGKSTAHSISAKLHGICADYKYELIDVKDEEELEKVLSDASYDGFNVTNPYKQAVMKYLDEVSELAKQVDAVNTIKRMPDGRLVGYNTDVYGFRFLVTRNMVGKKALVLGTGGAARAAVKSLTDHGARPVIYVSRNPVKAHKELPAGSIVIGYEDIARHSDTRLIVNATPVGMYPDISKSPLDEWHINLKRFKQLELAIDLIYNPYRTRFIQDVERFAGRENLPIFNAILGQLRVGTVSGLDMLIRQALLSREIWLANDATERVPEKASAKVHGEDSARTSENNSEKSSERAPENNSEKASERTPEKIREMDILDEEALFLKRRLLEDQLNITLIGMPGSGKSSISRQLAKELDRTYIDIDKKTEELLGGKIEDYLLDDEETMEHFRDMESKALEENCALSSNVIATGGGSVLRPQNRDYIKCNSIVVYLKRPISQLSLKHRPLSQREGVDKLYNERVGIYRRLADFHIGNEHNFGETFNRNGGRNSYMYDIKRFSYKIKKKVGVFIDEIVDYQWTQYELAWLKRARALRKEDV